MGLVLYAPRRRSPSTDLLKLDDRLPSGVKGIGSGRLTILQRGYAPDMAIHKPTLNMRSG